MRGKVTTFRLNPSARELSEFLRTLAPDMIARPDGENVVVEIKTSSPASFEAIQRLASALEHRAGWQVVYVDPPDPEWQPPAGLPATKDLLARLDLIGSASDDEDQSRLDYLLLWSIIEAAARHRVSALKIPPPSRISSSALLKMTGGIIEDDDYGQRVLWFAAEFQIGGSRAAPCSRDVIFGLFPDRLGIALEAVERGDMAKVSSFGGYERIDVDPDTRRASFETAASAASLG